MQLKQMIVPDFDGVSNDIKEIYGDWTAGQIISGLNAKIKNILCECDEHQYITFKTAEQISLNSLNTYFIINVYDVKQNKLISIKSQKITNDIDNAIAVRK